MDTDPKFEFFFDSSFENPNIEDFEVLPLFVETSLIPAIVKANIIQSPKRRE
jgi:hypothetical protein